MKHLLAKPVLAILSTYLTALFILDYVGIDLWLADIFFQLEGMSWSLKHHWITENLLHEGGRVLNYFGVLFVLLLTVYWHVKKENPIKTQASYRLVISLLLSFSLVNYLKSITNIDCPWDLLMYGGDMPYVHLFADKPDQLSLSRCFPAGHASAGYAWIALYYFFRSVNPRWKVAGLMTGIMLGLVFGFAQQLRGAHFLSHDLTTFVICWMVPYFVFNYPKALIAESRWEKDIENSSHRG